MTRTSNQPLQRRASRCLRRCLWNLTRNGALVLFAGALCSSARGEAGAEPRHVLGEVIVHFAPRVVDLPVDPGARTIPIEDVPIRNDGVRKAIEDLHVFEFVLVGRELRSVEPNPPTEEYVPIQLASFRHWYVLRFPEETPVSEAIERLRQESGILWAERNVLLEPAGYWPNDQYLSCPTPPTCPEPYQWNFKNSGGTINCIPCSTGFDIGMEGAYALWSICNVKVGILDTGCDSNHPDLAANLDTNLDYNSANPDNPNDTEDEDGHGTSAAGVIGALHNNGGVAGICGRPQTGFKVLVPIRISDLPQYPSTTTTLIDALTYCISHASEIPIALIEVYFLLDSHDAEDIAAQRNAIYDAFHVGLFVATAAGNDNPGVPYPSAIRHMNVSTTAIGCDGTKEEQFLNGSWIDLSAPGHADDGEPLENGQGQIVTTKLTPGSGADYRGLSGDPCEKDYFNGTSAACPHTAGAAALLRSFRPQLTNEDLEQVLLRTAAPMGSAIEFGKGLLQVDDALELLDSRTLVHGTTGAIQASSLVETRPQYFRNVQLTAGGIGAPPMYETYVETRSDVYEFTSTVILSQHVDPLAPVHAWVRGRESVAARDTTEYDGLFEPYVGDVTLVGNVATLHGYTYKVFSPDGTQFWGWYPLKLPLTPASPPIIFSYTYLADTTPAPYQPPAWGLQVLRSFIPLEDGVARVEFRGALGRTGRLVVTDVLGRIVEEISVIGEMDAVRVVEWEGRTRAGERVAAGFYFGRLEVGDETGRVRFLVVR